MSNLVFLEIFGRAANATILTEAEIRQILA
jgi:hypothetical protein